MGARAAAQHLNECKLRPGIELSVQNKRVLVVSDIPEVLAAVRLWASAEGAEEIFEAEPQLVGAPAQGGDWAADRGMTGEQEDREWTIRLNEKPAFPTAVSPEEGVSSKRQRMEAGACPAKRCGVAVVSTSLDFRDCVQVVGALAKEGWLDDGAQIISKIQPNPSGFGSKKARQYAKKPRLRRTIRMNEHVSKCLQNEYEVTMRHLVLDKEGERTACLHLKSQSGQEEPGLGALSAIY